MITSLVALLYSWLTFQIMRKVRRAARRGIKKAVYLIFVAALWLSFAGILYAML